MLKELLISATTLETRMVILEENQPTQVFFERKKRQGVLGNIYKGKVTKIVPGMQAAFVDLGLDRDAFLYVSDILADYDEHAVPLEGPYKEPAKPSSYESSGLLDKDPSRPLGGFSDGSARALIGEILPDKLNPLPPPMEVTEHVPEILPDQMDRTDLPSAMRGNEYFSPQGTALQPKIESKKEVLFPQGGRTNRNTSGSGDAQPLIKDLLREGQEILVQVAKEPIGKKGARITSQIVFPGRYLVFMPTVRHVGISRKIVSEPERRRLKDIVIKLRGDFGGGFIVRTVGEGRKQPDFLRDMKYLTGLWKDLRAKADGMSGPLLVHSELGLVQRVLRDHFSEDFRVARVDDQKEYDRSVHFMKRFRTNLVDRFKLYNKDLPMMDEFGVTAELERALKRKVWLKRGAYIVINQTEALVAIDVNTGRFVGKTNSLEETITQTNLAAVKEIVRQIRLRDLGGIIVIDFIDMEERKNRQKVMAAMKDELSRDKSPSRILQFNEFGLIAITRKRVRQSLERTLCQPCHSCNGRGTVKSVQTICYSIHQEIRRMLPHLGAGLNLAIRCHPDIRKALQSDENLVVKEIAKMTGKEVLIKEDPLMHIEKFNFIDS